MAQLRISRKSYFRKSYTQKGGARVKGGRVKGSTFMAEDRGAPGRGEKLLEIKHPGALGGAGFFEKSETEQKEIVSRVAREKGPKVAVGTLRALQVFNKRTNPKISKRAAELAGYVAQEY